MAANVPKGLQPACPRTAEHIVMLGALA